MCTKTSIENLPRGGRSITKSQWDCETLQPNCYTSRRIMFVESTKRRSRGQEVRGDCQELGGARVRKSLGSWRAGRGGAIRSWSQELRSIWKIGAKLGRSWEAGGHWSYREGEGDGRSRSEAGGSGSRELREKNKTTTHTHLNLQGRGKRRGTGKVLRPHQIGDSQESHRTRENKNPTRLS